MLPPALIQPPGVCTPGLCGGMFLWISFPHPGGNFLTFYASSYNVQFGLLGLSGNGSEPFGGQGWSCFPPTDPAFGPCLLLDLNPVAVLCCADSQDPEQGHLSQKSSALPPLWPVLQPHPIVSHSMSLPAVPVGSVAVRPSVFETRNQSLVPGLLQGCLYRRVAAVCAVSK